MSQWIVIGNVQDKVCINAETLFSIRKQAERNGDIYTFSYSSDRSETVIEIDSYKVFDEVIDATLDGKKWIVLDMKETKYWFNKTFVKCITKTVSSHQPRVIDCVFECDKFRTHVNVPVCNEAELDVILNCL